MSNLLHSAFRIDLSQVLTKSVVLGVLSTTSILGGAVPCLVAQPLSAIFDSLAYAQSFSSEEITNYAKAVLAIERVRKAAFTEIKRTSDQMPSVVCSQADALERLSEGARKIFVDYCQQSKTIVENHGLTPSRFNEITLDLRNNVNLQKKIRSELIRLQR